MSVFLEKSNQNASTSVYLVNKGRRVAVAHCAYYSSLQLIFHILFVKQGKSKAQFDQECKVNGYGTHDRAFNMIKASIKGVRYKDLQKFIETFYELKKLRTISDYSEDFLSPDECEDAIKLSEYLKTFLDSHFN